MRCPHCSNLDDKVLESRMLSTGESIRRRRECLKCGYRFTSYEQIEEKQLLVIKKEGRREPFDMKKLEKGITRAVEKRPVSQTEIDELLLNIASSALLKAGNSHEISSADIGEMVLNALYPLDPVAYVRFASVYRKFENVEGFIKEIEQLSRLQAGS